jgi:serine/threonine-protein kinase RsbW
MRQSLGTITNSGGWTMPKRRFSAVMDSLREALSWILARGREAGLTDDRLFKVELACEEALTNVIRYAYPDGVGDMLVWAESGARGFEVRIMDEGVPFNPVQMDLPDTGLSLEDREIGGLGILMASEMADEIIYSRDGNRNRLVLIWNSQ